MIFYNIWIFDLRITIKRRFILRNFSKGANYARDLLYNKMISKILVKTASKIKDYRNHATKAVSCKTR